MVSNASEDLPEPESPVTTMRRSRGISTEMFFRLWTRAPCTAIVVRAAASGEALLRDDVLPRFDFIRDLTCCHGARERAHSPVQDRAETPHRATSHVHA